MKKLFVVVLLTVICMPVFASTEPMQVSDPKAKPKAKEDKCVIGDIAGWAWETFTAPFRFFFGGGGGDGGGGGGGGGRDPYGGGVKNEKSRR